MSDDAKLKIESLRQQVLHHQRLYYIEDDPVLDDAEFDALFRELVDYEHEYPQYSSADSPTHRVGGKASSRFPEAKHVQPMLSLGNAMDAQEAAAFLCSVGEALGVAPGSVMLCKEPKYDGLSCATIYRNGHLQQGITRGDGETGEDITPNLLAVDNVPHYIPALKDVPRFEVRGEVVMTIAAFTALNDRQRAAGEKLFKNPRNAAAGSLRNSDPNVTRSRPLKFFAYNTGACTPGTEFKCEGQFDTLQMLRSFGFTVSEHAKLIEARHMQAEYEQIGNLRATLGYEIDGVVYKVNDLAAQKQMGWTSRTPKWAIAYKFLPEQVPTQVLAIDVQVGRTGELCPVARVKPVRVGGVDVTNATLHNADRVAFKDVRVGDTVLMVRNGDVVPGIERVMLERRPANTIPFKMPTTCPSCGSPAVKAEGQAATMCTGGSVCPAQRLGTIDHFASRPCLDIDGLAEGKIQILIDANLLTTPSDLYKLTVTDVQRLPGFGARSAESLVSAIQASRRPTLRKFLYALGMPEAGEGTSKRLAKQFGSFEAILQATKDEIEAVKDIGPITANAVYGFLHHPVSGMEARTLATLVQPQDEQRPVMAATSLQGKTFVVTGTLSVPREDIHALIEAHGGTAKGSVSKNTHYLVAGDKAGGKIATAQALGVTVLDEAAFRAMLRPAETAAMRI